ncbi:hypothetical protein L5515_005934 [Caenorhabditis briggsae]|uniref:PHD-type domain-containing protein n=1 Tax=Caenorhabditis briggsae TaxID=6238 RepID=A0AAE9EZ95_CAEBR|nr:hypothetical protein L5515_005934 [Caenorhabditis briggsae]
MSDSEPSIAIDEDPDDKAEASEAPKFEANAYISQLIGFMKSTEKDANEKFAELVKKTWQMPSDSNNFCTPSYSLDSGSVSKLPQSMMAQKRIAGTQRLMFAPGLNKPGLDKASLIASASSASGSGPSSVGMTALKKAKKQVPVIDDSIYCTTDQPCKTCGGVSQAGNQVLACKNCRDCFHMRCSVPPVSVEEASEPSFVYHCKTCLISKKVMSTSRSRSPSPQVVEAKKMRMTGRTKP